MVDLLEICWFVHHDQVCDSIWRLFKVEVGLDFEFFLHDEDSSLLKAHSLILKIFCPEIANLNCKQFRFVDSEIKANDVRCLLEFIYRGKIKVEKERLEVLKKAAEILGLGVFVELVNDINKKLNFGIKEKFSPSQNKINSENDGSETIILSYGDASDLLEEVGESTKRNDEVSLVESVTEKVNLSVSEIPELKINDPKIADQEHSYSSKRKLNVENEVHTIESCQSSSDFQVPESNSSFEGDDSEPVTKKIKYSLRQRKDDKCSSLNKKNLPKPNVKCNSKVKKLSSVSQYICPRCGKTFNKISSMKEHLEAHYADKVLSQCPLCPNQYRNLKSHLAFKHHRDVKGNLLEKSLKCEQCDYACADKYQLQKHNKQKHGDRCHKCDQCSYSSTTNSSLSRHKKQVHSLEKRFMCDTCGTFFKSRSCLRQHIRSHSEFRKECDVCGLSVRCSYLGAHMKIHGNKRFQCVACECNYRRKCDLKIHLKKIHKMEDEEINNISASNEIIVEIEKGSENEDSENNKVICDICGKVLSNCSLSRHNMMFHSDVKVMKRHKCCFEECSEAFAFRSKLRAHLTKKHKMPDEEIDDLFKKDFEQKIQEVNERRKLEDGNEESGIDFWNQRIPDVYEESKEDTISERELNSNTVAEIVVNHDNYPGLEKQMHVCQICDKGFQNEIVFIRHVKFHSLNNSKTKSNSEKRKIHPDKRKTLMCPICDRKFKWKLGLDRHIEAHSDPKALFKCPYCPHQSKYLEAHLAEKHQRDMYGNVLEKSFKCEQCEYSCTAQWKLLYHARVKHGERTHKCELCPFSSTTNGQLAKHKREVHTNEKKFVCETCGASFKSKNYLVKHGNTHSGMKIICEICGISLSSKHNVARHMKLHSDSLRKITCPVCYTFGARDRHNLKEHLKKKHKLAKEEIVSFMENI